ncbi:MAG: M50 family metallopeptidase [Desulfurococcales archaeon]|nr:M50 family metallopeptidase [Desulfurococcales archaeon]
MAVLRFNGSQEIGEPVSWVLGVLVSLFSIIKIYNIFNINAYISGSSIGLIVGLVLHELAHRYVSRRNGLYAEFVAYKPGLLLTALSGFIPNIILITPGYVKTTIYSYVPGLEKAITRSVAAGPATNLILSLLGYLAAHVAGSTETHIFLADFASINAWVAFFNLLPIPPLDGSKLFRYNKMLWGALIILSLILLL